MRGAVSRAAPVVYLYPNPGYLPRLGASASLARAIITKPMTINTHGFCMAPLFLCYSMIWSARSNSDCGIFRLSALAVLRLMASSNFVGCTIGRSLGFAPERSRPV